MRAPMDNAKEQPLSSPHAQARSLGSFGGWVWARTIQLLALLFWASTTSTLVRFRGPDVTDLLVLVMFLAFSIELHSLAYGAVDESGVSYRRYFTKHFAQWEQVSAVEWDAQRVVIFFGTSGQVSHRADFMLSSSLMDWFRQTWRGATPEIVQWLDQTLAGRVGSRIAIRRRNETLFSKWREGRIGWSDVFFFILFFLVLLVILFVKGGHG